MAVSIDANAAEPIESGAAVVVAVTTTVEVVGVPADEVVATTAPVEDGEPVIADEPTEAEPVVNVVSTVNSAADAGTFEGKPLY